MKVDCSINWIITLLLTWLNFFNCYRNVCIYLSIKKFSSHHYHIRFYSTFLIFSKISRNTELYDVLFFEEIVNCFYQNKFFSKKNVDKMLRYSPYCQCLRPKKAYKKCSYTQCFHVQIFIKHSIWLSKP